MQDCSNKLLQKSVLRDCISVCFDICAMNIRVSIRVRGLHLVSFFFLFFFLSSSCLPSFLVPPRRHFSHQCWKLSLGTYGPKPYGELQSSLGAWGLEPYGELQISLCAHGPEHMPERMSDTVGCQNKWQIQTGCQKEWQVECQMACQLDRTSDYMSDRMPDRMS